MGIQKGFPYNNDALKNAAVNENLEKYETEPDYAVRFETLLRNVIFFANLHASMCIQEFRKHKMIIGEKISTQSFGNVSCGIKWKFRKYEMIL